MSASALSASCQLQLQGENKEVEDGKVKMDKSREVVDMINIVPELPKGCKPLPHQVAGHRYGKGRLGIGMLQHNDGSIMKPLQPPPRGTKEQHFYERAFDDECTDPILITLRPFLPRLLDVWCPSAAGVVNQSPPSYSYLKLEDVCRRFRNPSILDIKIGRVSYDPNADEQKRMVEISKYPPLQEIGFQLLGMRISGMSSNEATFYDKHYGRSLSKEGIIDGLNLYLSGNKSWKKYIVKSFIHRLELILNWFESQSRYQFYASSLLMIYEGESLDQNSSSDSDENSPIPLPSTAVSDSSYLSTVKKLLKMTTTNDVTSSSTNDVTSSSTNDVTSSSTNDVTSSSTNDVTNEKMTETGRPLPTITITGSGGNPESGYSSEAESKKAKNDAIQRKFVASLSRKIEESVTGGKHRSCYPDIVDVRMIDFAHVYEEEKTDENYIYGLRNLIEYFRRILKQL